MSADCPNLAGCGFIQKWGEQKNLACRGFISSYCKGPKQDECKRKEFKARHQRAPDDNMMPNGMTVA